MVERYRQLPLSIDRSKVDAFLESAGFKQEDWGSIASLTISATQVEVSMLVRDEYDGHLRSVRHGHGVSVQTVTVNIPLAGGTKHFPKPDHLTVFDAHSRALCSPDFCGWEALGTEPDPDPGDRSLENREQMMADIEANCQNVLGTGEGALQCERSAGHTDGDRQGTDHAAHDADGVLHRW